MPRTSGTINVVAAAHSKAENLVLAVPVRKSLQAVKRFVTLLFSIRFLTIAW